MTHPDDDYDSERINLDDVVDALHELGIPAVIEHDSGGTYTLYAGHLDDRYDDDDPRRYPVSLGPIDADHTGLTYDMDFGPTGDDTAGSTVHSEESPGRLAERIAVCVRAVERERAEAYR